MFLEFFIAANLRVVVFRSCKKCFLWLAYGRMFGPAEACFEGFIFIVFLVSKKLNKIK